MINITQLSIIKSILEECKEKMEQYHLIIKDKDNVVDLPEQLEKIRNMLPEIDKAIKYVSDELTFIQWVGRQNRVGSKFTEIISTVNELRNLKNPENPQNPSK